MTGRKAQSAMEYLMTYGWAIIVILVVLAVLYILGIFTPNKILGTQCNALFKYSCQNLHLATNGSVSFLLGQNSGTTEYNIAVACTQTKNATGGPNPSTAWMYLNSTGAVKSSYPYSNTYLFESGTFAQVNNIPCYSSTGSLLGSQKYGAGFTGFLWIKYTNLPGTPGGANPTVLSEVASVQVSVGAGGSGSGSGGGSTTTSTTATSSTTSIQGTYLTASGTSATTSLNETPGKYSLYICGGVASGGNISPYPGITAAWTVDQQDSVSGGPYSSIGHSSSGCSATTSSTPPNLTIAAIGLNGSPTYSTYLKNGTGGNLYVNVSYTVSTANSFVVLVGTCGFEYGPCSAASLPTGCTQRQSLTDAVGFDSVYIATCQSQAVGPIYYFNYSVSCQITKTCVAVPACKAQPCPTALTDGAYIFPDYTPTGS